MKHLRQQSCCFSGYRVEKMPFPESDCMAVDALAARLDQAVAAAAADGLTRFFTGMSTGFDLWAAEAVLRAREQLGLTLLAVVPFDAQAAHFSPAWKRTFNAVLLQADKVFSLSRAYHAGCYAARNRFMVDASCRLICYFSGKPGGTAQTVRYAREGGLDIVNLAETQLRLEALS